MPTEHRRPAPAAKLDPKLTILPTGTRLYRVHRSDYSALEFNPNRDPEQRPGRFHPFKDHSSKPVPTLYAADSIDGALSETIFHNVCGGQSRGAILRRRLKNQMLSIVETTNPLTLVDLRGHGLRRLGLKRNQLLESEANEYAWTVTWAAALYGCSPIIQGLLWVSRQFDTATGMVLFGDRVACEHLQVIDIPRPLYQGSTYKEVLRIATEAKIMIIE